MSKSLTIVAILTSLALGGCLGGTDGGELAEQSAYQRGKFHFNARQFGLAVNHFESAIRREPNSVEALNGLAASYDRLGRYDLSARYYERALAADPESAQTLNNIGYSYLLQERFDLAVAYLRDAQSRDRKDPVVLANRKTAEVSYQETDLKRSAEEARAERAAALASTSSRSQVAAQAPVSLAASSSSQRVKPWIERTAPNIQTLVTQPQVAFLGAVEEVGIDPQLAAYRPRQPKATELLPDHAAAPMTLDAPAPTERGEVIHREVRSAPTAPAVPSTLMDRGQHESLGAVAWVLPEARAELPDGIDAVRSAPVEVASVDVAPVEVAPVQVAAVEVASVEVAPVEVAPVEVAPGQAIVASLVPARTMSDVAPVEVAPVQVAPVQVAAVQVVPVEVAPVNVAPVHVAPVEVAPVEVAPGQVIVASLVPARTMSDVAPSQELTASVATTELVTPDVVLSDLDPLDALEDDDLLEAADGTPQEAAGAAPAEVEVASLGAVIADPPRVDAQLALVGSLPLVEVSNGTGRLDMAARIRDYLEAKGIVVKRLTNAEDYRHQETVVYYRSGWRAYAEDLARLLPAVIDLDDRPGQESDVRLELGGDLLEFDRGLYYAVMRSNGANRG
ncbi:MAG: tetratricopeptide repeat protein [Alphaproteobacteria bacterium]